MEVEHRRNSCASSDSNEDILIKKQLTMELEEENGASTDISKSENKTPEVTDDISPFPMNRRLDELEELELKEAHRKKSDDTKSIMSEDSVQRNLHEVSEASKFFFDEILHEWTTELADEEFDKVLLDAKITSTLDKFSLLKGELELEVIPADDMAAIKKVIAICEWMREVCRKNIFIFNENNETWTYRRLCYIVQKMKELGIPEDTGIGRELIETHQKGSSIMYDYENEYEEKRKVATLTRESMIPLDEAKRMLEELKSLRGTIPVEEQIKQIRDDLDNLYWWEDKLQKRINEFAGRLVYHTMRTTPYQTPDKSLDDRVSLSHGIDKDEAEILRLRKEAGQTVIKSLKREEFVKKSEWLFNVSKILKKMIKDFVGKEEMRSVRVEGKILEDKYELSESEKALIKYLGEESPEKKDEVKRSVEKFRRIESPEVRKPVSVKKETWQRDSGSKSGFFERSARRLMEEEESGKKSQSKGRFISNMEIMKKKSYIKKEEFPFDLDDMNQRLDRMLTEIRSESSKSPFRYNKARSEDFRYKVRRDLSDERDCSCGGYSAYAGSPWRKPRAVTEYGSGIMNKFKHVATTPERENYTRRPYRDPMVTFNIGKLRNDDDDKKHQSIKKMFQEDRNARDNSANSRLSKARSVHRMDSESPTFSENDTESRWKKNLPAPEITISPRRLDPSPRRWHDQEADLTTPLYNPDYAGTSRRNSERRRMPSENDDIPNGTVLKIFDGVLKCGEDTRCPKVSLYTCSKHDIVTSIPQLTEDNHMTLKATGRFTEEKFDAYFSNIIDGEIKDPKVISGWIDSHVTFYQNHLNQIAKELVNTHKIAMCTSSDSSKVFLMHKQQMKTNWKRALNFEIKKTQQKSNPSLYFILVHKPYKLEFTTKSIAPEIVPIYDECDDALSVQLESFRESQKKNREARDNDSLERSPTLSFGDSDFGVTSVEEASTNLWEERRPATPMKAATIPAKKLETISPVSLNGKRTWEEISNGGDMDRGCTGDPKKKWKSDVAAFQEEEEDGYEEEREEVTNVNPLLNVIKRMDRSEMIETLLDMETEEIVEVAKEMDKETRDSVIGVLQHISGHKKERNNRRLYKSPRYVRNLYDSFTEETEEEDFQPTRNFVNTNEVPSVLRPTNLMNNQDFQTDMSFNRNYGYVRNNNNNNNQRNWKQNYRSPQKNRNPYYYNNENYYAEQETVNDLSTNMLNELGFMFDGNSIVMSRDAYEGITQLQEMMGLPQADPIAIRTNRQHYNNNKRWKKNKRFY